MKNKSEMGMVDKISELPDDVLVNIISRLTPREAIATSILSTHWRHLYYTYTTRLIYITRHPSEQSKDKYIQQLQEKEFAKYMKKIYDFLTSKKNCMFLKEFKMHIPCLKGANIKRWLPLVLGREVESIDIRMIYHTKAMPGYYNFPATTLIKRKGGGSGSFPGLKSLRHLSLHSLHVDDRVVELFVSNCTALEHLSIVGSYRLKNASLVGHSKLKHLDISSCRNVLSIEVRDMINLVSLTCYRLHRKHSQPKYSLLLNNVPKLVEFNSSDQSHILGHVFNGIPSSILDQLVQINIQSTDLEDHSVLCDCMRMPIPKLMNLKHLKLQMTNMHGRAWDLACFVLKWQCPNLQKLEIELLWSGFEDIDDEYYYGVLLIHRNGWMQPKPNSHLKEVTLSGYVGSPDELRLASFIIRKAVKLEKLTVEPCRQTPEIRQKATTLAREHFLQIKPDKVDLVIL